MRSTDPKWTDVEYCTVTSIKQKCQVSLKGFNPITRIKAATYISAHYQYVEFLCVETFFGSNGSFFNIMVCLCLCKVLTKTTWLGTGKPCVPCFKILVLSPLAHLKKSWLYVKNVFSLLLQTWTEIVLRSPLKYPMIMLKNSFELWPLAWQPSPQ